MRGPLFLPLLALSACSPFEAADDKPAASDAGSSTTPPSKRADSGTTTGGCAQVALTETFDDDLSNGWTHFTDPEGTGNLVTAKSQSNGGNPGDALQIEVPGNLALVSASYYSHALDPSKACVAVSIDMKANAPPSATGINFMTLHLQPAIDFIVSYTIASTGKANILVGEQDESKPPAFHALGTSTAFADTSSAWHTIEVTYASGPTFTVTVDHTPVTLAPLTTHPNGPIALYIGDVYTYAHETNSILLDNVHVR